MGPHYLDRLFSPTAVAVYGASDRPGAVGTEVWKNLQRAGFQGALYPVNPKYAKIKTRRCYPDLVALPRAVDLAVIATPAATVPDILRDCGEHGVRAAIVLSAGLGNGGPESALQAQVLERAHHFGIRILGPNCLGLIRPSIGLNATFSKNDAIPGKLALVSQSGALCTAILDWAASHGVGFSAVVSMGDALDVDFGDVLDYLALDANTQSILLYVEGLRHARQFMSGLRVAARLKPVIVLKAGRHAEGSRAAVSHTGALLGGDDVFDAALQRAGVVRVQTVEQWFAAAQFLTSHRSVRGNRLAIVTNGGGPAVMAVDRAVDLGVEPATLAPQTLARLDAALPPHWSKANPIDILGDADAARYAAAVQASLADPNVDGVLAMLTPQAMTDPLACAQAVIDAAADHDKPLLGCWMGERQVRTARELFTANRIAWFTNPEASVEAFSYLAAYHRNQQLLLQAPGPLARRSEPDLDGARLIVEAALEARRSTLSTTECRAVLTAFGIPVTPAIEAHSCNEALIAAESLGFPVAMKINSPDVLHKSDVDGVRLNIHDARSIRSAYNNLLETVRARLPHAELRGVTVERMYRQPHGRELIIGVARDPVFGPVVAFGAGGTAVEVLRDRAVTLPPVNSFIAANLIAQTRVSRLLGQFRNLPAVNIEALEQVLCRVSEMVCELPRIRELDINPLTVDETGAMALDARIALDWQTPSVARYGHMAIHPYPSHLVRQLQMADGTELTIRPIRPEDAEIEQQFVRALSPRARYFRFMQSLRELTPEMLIRFTQIDYDRELAFIAVVDERGRETEVGVARYTMNPDGRSCEFALVVADAWQRRGIGSRLMDALVAAARERGFHSMEGEVLADNREMLALARNLGFAVQTSPEDTGIRQVHKEL